MNTSGMLRAPLRALTALLERGSRGPDPQDLRAQAAAAAAASAAAYERHTDGPHSPAPASAATLADDEAHGRSLRDSDPSPATDAAR